ncbi:MAG: bifunctional D-glycero-beta-D-manno-heptose-7-phosphate kinase/D-glycero-beta-D-manno-heptose 1-phosphate adenylyltransferase HldE [Pseudomonadota bacterium]
MRGKSTALKANVSQTNSVLNLPDVGHLHVLVVGDVMLDRYWVGDADRVSPEAPVPVVLVNGEDQRPGGAANVALNLVSLGAHCTLVGFVGDDEPGRVLQETLEAAGVVCDFVKVPDWPTVVKLRILAQQQQLIRADFEAPIPDFAASERLGVLLNKVEKNLQNAQVCILEDYDKGTVEDPEALIHAASNAGIPVLVDPKMKPLSRYANATVVKPNEKEFYNAVRLTQAIEKDQALSEQAQQMCAAHSIGGLIVTRGGQGMDVCTASDSHHVPARSVEVFDVTGAGDTTAAALALGLGLEWSLFDCARLANTAASIVVSKSGTSPVTAPELRLTLAGRTADQGVLDIEDLTRAVEDAKAAGERIVFTNGCFDILHAGHVTYLEEAAALGQRLIVAINDDASVTALKGPGRPVIPVESRARVLAGLGCVDWVVSFPDDTPIPLLKRLQPDVLVKGGDYGPEEVVGADLVTSAGGEVRVLSLVENVSTTRIVDAIKEGEG